MEPPKKGKIESFVHDQGGGFSWCDQCQYPIDLETIGKQQYICPSCKCDLLFGDISINWGGSDF